MRVVVWKVVVDDEHLSNVAEIFFEDIYCTIADKKGMWRLCKRNPGTEERFLWLRFWFNNC